MIGYRLSKSALEKKIESFKKGWLEKAAERTAKFKKAGSYDEESSIWSQVKPVYMEIQGGSKCAYCERKLESVELGTAEQDVEHFRPKGRVSPWPLPDSLKAKGVEVSKVPKSGGYYLLPYHIFNYCASCKPCNSALKSDHFPIAGKYRLKGDDPEDLAAEMPLLVYPIGDFDDDPEKIISFHGTSPYAVAKSGHKRMRALVTIEFFQLDKEEKRKNLYRERAMIIIALYSSLKKLADGAKGSEKEVAEAIISGFTGSNCAHANCSRSFAELFERDSVEAEAMHLEAVKFINSKS